MIEKIRIKPFCEETCSSFEKKSNSVKFLSAVQEAIKAYRQMKRNNHIENQQNIHKSLNEIKKSKKELLNLDILIFFRRLLHLFFSRQDREFEIQSMLMILEGKRFSDENFKRSGLSKLFKKILSTKETSHAQLNRNFITMIFNIVNKWN